MTGIDEVIARSRQPGGFSERRTFTVARSRAIEKMRQFALADPHFYILELIQSAVANGANYISVQCSPREMTLSYTGGGFHEAELARLFDFLFASREDVEQGALRLLALGTNALLAFEPLEIVLESGDGTLQGTTRVAIGGKDSTFEVGRPEQALNGTFIRAVGLNRRRVAGRSSLKPGPLGPPECTAIEERCLTAPVPIFVNNEPLFGYSSQRVMPALFGFQKTLTFDEGDLYGTIGVAARSTGAVFRLVTHGVWIQSVEHDFGNDALIGGVVVFDRLNKTADHAAIVRDARYSEMWMRLRPYVIDLLGGGAGAAGSTIRLHTQPDAPLQVALRTVREAGGAVLVSPTQLADADRGERTRQHAEMLGELMELPVVVADRREHRLVREVLGPGAAVVEPDVGNLSELGFYQQTPLEAPPRPWLIEPTELEPLRIADVIEWVRGEEAVRESDNLAIVDAFRSRLNHDELVHCTLYVPRSDEAADASTLVRFTMLGRLLHTVRVDIGIAATVLDVALPALPLSIWRKAWAGGTPPLVGPAAHVIARHVYPELEAAANRALMELVHHEVAPGSTAARMILGSIHRHCIKRLRVSDEGRAQVRFALLDGSIPASFLSTPVFRTHTGEAVSVRDLEVLLERGGGLVYGTIPGVEADLRGLDTRLVLDLDEGLEALLIALVGKSAYVRVDCRDVLARHEDLLVRDVAVGLRDYAEFPLLVERIAPEAPGATPVGPEGDVAVADFAATKARIYLWDEQKRIAVVQRLVRELRALLDSDPASCSQEDRRQALRQLQYFVCTRHRFAGMPDFGLDERPMFLTLGRRVCTFAQIREAVEDGLTLRMFDGVAADVATFDPLSFAALKWKRDNAPTLDLAMNPYVHALLVARFGALMPTLDTAVLASEQEQLGGERYLHAIRIHEQGIEGEVGVPFVRALSPKVLAVDYNRESVRPLEDVARIFGVTGVVRADRYMTGLEGIEQVIGATAERIIEAMTARVARGEWVRGTPEFDRAVEHLLEFAGRAMQFVKRPGGGIEVDITWPCARGVLELPLFPGRGGAPLTAWRLVREFVIAANRTPDHALALEDWYPALVSDTVPPSLDRWVRDHLAAAWIHSPADSRRMWMPLPPVVPARDASPDEHAHARLARTVEHWLAVLRPDFDSVSGTLLRGLHLPVRIVAHDEGLARNVAGYNSNRPNMLDLNSQHWLVRWVLDTPDDDPRPLAWLLIATYAHLNVEYVTVTNEHELKFQQRVFETLQAGRLTPIDDDFPLPTP